VSAARAAALHTPGASRGPQRQLCRPPGRNREYGRWDTAGSAGGQAQLSSQHLNLGPGGLTPLGARQGGAAVKRYWWLLVALLMLTALLAKLGAAGG
jgi:hypothetical protein